MAEIKPAEIPQPLRKQVEGFESGATPEEVGTVLKLRWYCCITGYLMFNTSELVEFDNGLEAIVLNLKTMLVWYFEPSTGIKEGSTAKKNTTYCFSLK
jgi:F-type H+-transporting ATPase subunit alpha